MEQGQGNTFVTTLKSGNVTFYGVSDEENLGNVVGGSSESSNVNPAETTISWHPTATGLQRNASCTNNDQSILNTNHGSKA